MPHQKPEVRVRNFDEVALGLELDAALVEAERCLRCKKPRCVPGCPVSIDIPGFISALARRDMRGLLPDSEAVERAAGGVRARLPAGDAVRGDLRRRHQAAAGGRSGGWSASWRISPWGAAGTRRRRRCATATGKRAAIIGSGPAGLACAGDLARAGVKVTVFEALHVAGGVLKYGIPEFRLPDIVIDQEIENLRKLGVEIRLDTIIGKLFTIPQLMSEMGYDAVFVGTGAGSPKFMGIPGRGLQRRLLGQRVPDAREPDARPPAADLRYAGGDGQARGGGRRGQHRHGRLRAWRCAWARRR